MRDSPGQSETLSESGCGYRNVCAPHGLDSCRGGERPEEEEEVRVCVKAGRGHGESWTER